MIVGADCEWGKDGNGGYKIDVLGLAYDEGRQCTATSRDSQTIGQFLDILRKANSVIMQNGIDADCMQLAGEGIDTTWLEPKIIDTRLLFYAATSHLAGSGSFDLRSIALLSGARQGYRWPLEHKQYETDLFKTCAMDASCALWLYPTLDRQIQQYKLQPTVDILHKCAGIFARMKEQGVKLDRGVLEQIYKARETKTVEIIEKYHLWEERGKKVIKRVPIWRSNKVLEIFEQNFGVKIKDRQRATWQKLLAGHTLTPEATEFAEAIVSLGEGANDAHWLGKAEETEDGLDFTKVSDNGFIYPRYDICGSPDRAIASGPNISNFPRPSDDPRPVKLRSAVIPLDESHIILGCDFSSVETITNAFESKDMDRVQAVLSKRISHEGTAEMINSTFGLELNRNQGKVCNHAFDKGESPYNLARRIFKTERPSRKQTAQCEQIFLRMLKEFPQTELFRNELWERARSNPLVMTNAFGRRYLCFSRSKYGDARENYAKHNPAKKYWCSCGECASRRDRWKYAIAFLGRSCAFDALLRVMARIWYEKRLDAYSLPYLEIHDELDFSVDRSMVQTYARLAKEAFEEPFLELDGISLPADIKWGDNWAAAH